MRLVSLMQRIWGIQPIKVIETPWYNLGESFTCGKDYGGPAFLGNTRAGIIGESALMEAEFFKFVRNYSKIGIGEALSKMTFNPDSYKNHINFKEEALTLKIQL